MWWKSHIEYLKEPHIGVYMTASESADVGRGWGESSEFVTFGSHEHRIRDILMTTKIECVTFGWHTHMWELPREREWGESSEFVIFGLHEHWVRDIWMTQTYWSWGERVSHMSSWNLTEFVTPGRHEHRGAIEGREWVRWVRAIRPNSWHLDDMNILARRGERVRQVSSGNSTKFVTFGLHQHVGAAEGRKWSHVSWLHVDDSKIEFCERSCQRWAGGEWIERANEASVGATEHEGSAVSSCTEFVATNDLYELIWLSSIRSERHPHICTHIHTHINTHTHTNVCALL